MDSIHQRRPEDRDGLGLGYTFLAIGIAILGVASALYAAGFAR